MISIFSVYAFTWTLVVALYIMRWSSLNEVMPGSALLFFIVTIGISAVLAVKTHVEKSVVLKWNRHRKPTITILLVAGFLADWAYSGQVPLFAEYQGFDPSSAGDAIVGIPMFHVMIIALIIFYIPYVFYRYISEHDKNEMMEILALFSILVLNKSRGYIVFCIICCIFIYMRMQNYEISHINLKMIATGVVGFALVCFFISAAGNMRHGFNWSDCSYIAEIGYFDNYPKGLTPHFMWAYSYITSSFGNLMYNLANQGDSFNPMQLVFSFLPESISSGHLPTPVYQVQHLNACTGYVSAVCSSGMLGMAVMYVAQMALYYLMMRISRKNGLLYPFTESMLSFLVLVNLFYSPFTTSAVCYIPVFLLILELYIRVEKNKGIVELSAIEPHDRGATFAKVKGCAHESLLGGDGEKILPQSTGCDVASYKGLVSVVLPIYNQETHLDSIIFQLRQQSYKYVEIIAVNDGSTDGSLEILERLAAEDNRIKIVNQKNRGLLGANVAGIKASSGDYVCFVDPDDVVGTDLISGFIADFDDDYDFIARGFYYKFGKNVLPFRLNRNANLDAGDLSRLANDFILDESLHMSNEIFVSRWNKIYRRKCLERFLEDYSAYQDVSLGEDSVFTLLLLKNAHKAKINPTPNTYYYVQHNGSMMNADAFDPYIEKCEIAYRALSDLSSKYDVPDSQALLLYFALTSGRMTKLIDEGGPIGRSSYRELQKIGLYRRSLREACHHSGWKRLGPVLQLYRCPAWLYQMVRIPLRR